MPNRKILVHSSSEYEYSLDGINFHNENLFRGLSGGEYLVSIREIAGCGFAEEKISILDFAKFFTPNNDGHNDYWRLKGNTDKQYSIKIFDRYGKLLKVMGTGGSWDGTFNGKELPANDYWFQVSFEDGQSKTGHFSLIR